jgi:3-dehydroquinate synthase
VKKIDYPNTAIYINKSFVNFFDCVDNIKKDTVFYFVDENILGLYKSLFNNFHNIISIPSGEETKSIDYINNIIKKLIELGANRKTFIIGVGGGVTCDVAGFVASIFMRGVNFGFVPTTLLAMTDASFGGKNGINFNNIKNVLGVINEPDFVFIDYSFLKTLTHQEYLNGFAEIIKHACISSSDLFYDLEKNADNYFKIIENPGYSNFNKLHNMLCDSIKIKLDIVSSDRYENGKRKSLNYGHTFGHAIEAEYGIPHGSAISLGIVFSNILSNKLGFLNEDRLIRVNNLLEKYNLPVDVSMYEKKYLIKWIERDKKSSDKNIDFVLLKDIGISFVKPLSIQKIIDG